MMATTKKTKAKKAAERKATNGKATQGKSTRQAKGASEAVSAIELLADDHREVEGYFEEYEELEDDDAKAALAAKICLALKVHTQIEEELFYPAARKATKDDDLLDEAVVEHAGAKHLIAEIEDMEVGDDLYDAKIKVLGEQIKHHVKEEEEELFPETESAKLDVEALGKKLAARKAELMAELSSDSGEAIDADRWAAGNKPGRG
jgi:hemerythrin HHE cation binding domain-containing protein